MIVADALLASPDGSPKICHIIYTHFSDSIVFIGMRQLAVQIIETQWSVTSQKIIPQ